MVVLLFFFFLARWAFHAAARRLSLAAASGSDSLVVVLGRLVVAPLVVGTGFGCTGFRSFSTQAQRLWAWA